MVVIEKVNKSVLSPEIRSKLCNYLMQIGETY